MLKKYQLRKKPFNKSIHTYPRAGQEEVFEALNKRLNSAFTASESKILILKGDYGYGKTFNLYKVLEKALKNEYESPVFPVYVESIEAEPPSKYAADLIHRIFKSIGEHYEINKFFEIASKADIEKIPGISSDIKNAFLELRNNNEDVYYWMIGELTSKTDLDKLGIRKPIKDYRSALSVFIGFHKLLKSAGYENFLILLEEFEYLVTIQSDNKLTQALKFIKDIYEAYGKSEYKSPDAMAKTVLLISNTPGSWAYIKDLEGVMKKRGGGGGVTPLLQRISESDVLELGPFDDPKMVEAMLVTRLKDARKKGAKVKPLYPFTSDYPKLIYVASHGVPRLIMEFSEVILNYAIENKMNSISASNAKDILQKFKLYSEEEASVEASG